jgi:hypothetical protein
MCLREFMKYKVIVIIFLIFGPLVYSQKNDSTISFMERENMKISKIEVVKKFIEAYNSLDVEKMITFLHPQIEFKNISNGEENTHTNGIAEFKELANKTLDLFKERVQRIISYTEDKDTINVEISYHAIFGKDLPSGIKNGDSIDLNGKSRYVFKDGLIILLIDES